jgi:hypothetical protein
MAIISLELSIKRISDNLSFNKKLKIPVPAPYSMAFQEALTGTIFSRAFAIAADLSW